MNRHGMLLGTKIQFQFSAPPGMPLNLGTTNRILLTCFEKLRLTLVWVVDAVEVGTSLLREPQVDHWQMHIA